MVELVLTICVLLLILYLGRVGADFGLFFELTSALLLLFAMFVTLRYWYLMANLLQTRTFLQGANATFVAYWVLFLLGSIPLILVLKYLNEEARPRYPSVLDKLLGFAFGLLAAAILLCCLMTSLAVFLPRVWEPYDRNALWLPLDEFPLKVYRHVEEQWLGVDASHPGHTRLPTLEKTDADHFDKYWR